MTQSNSIAPLRYSPILSARAVAFPEPERAALHVLIFPMADDGTIYCRRCERRLTATDWARPCAGKERR